MFLQHFRKLSVLCQPVRRHTVAHWRRRHSPRWFSAQTTDDFAGLTLASPKVQRFLESIGQEYEDLTRNEQRSRAGHRRLATILPLVKVMDERNSVLQNLDQLQAEMKEEKDTELVALIEEERKSFADSIDQLETDLMRSIFSMNEDESCSSLIFEVSTGVGGQEAMLFAREMFDMYCAYFEYKGWDAEVFQEDSTELGGIRHASAMVSGEDAFSLLQFEGGVHRVQRIPSTEKAGRVHTSTVSVAVIPKPDDLDLDIKAKDLKIETKRASGAGGQHVNTTDSAVRMVHLPTGIAVECQSERSQIKNRELALKKLQAKLCQQHIDKQMATTSASRKTQVGTSMRNEKIRTYNFNQDRITDHRLATGGTVHNLSGLLAGGEPLDDLIHKLLASHRKQQIIEMIENTK